MVFVLKGINLPVLEDYIDHAEQARACTS